MMKKIVYVLFLSLFVCIACSKEEQIQEEQTVNKNSITERQALKIEVCHYSKSDNFWNVISVNGNALDAHLEHGDVQLIDADGDGYVEQLNECVPGGDCDDNDATINPGAVEICGNSVDENCNGQTDEECGAGLAYSLRKFFSWSNAVLKIRRSSDNATAYLFFDGASSSDVITMSSYISTTSNTTPDATTLSTWIGSNNATVVDWIAQTPDDVYDGNLVLRQTVDSYQPNIITSGVIDTKNGLPAIDFNGIDNYLVKHAGALSELDSGNDFTVLTVSNADNTNYLGCIANTSSTQSQGCGFFTDTRTNAIFGFVIASTNASIEYLSRQNHTNQNLHTYISVGSALSLEGFLNGTTQETDTWTGSYTNNSLQIGRRYSTWQFHDGTMQEIIIFPSDKTADLTALHADINTYYSIY